MAGDRVLVAVGSHVTSGNPNVPTVAGLGVGWTQIGTVFNGVLRNTFFTGVCATSVTDLALDQLWWADPVALLLLVHRVPLVAGIAHHPGNVRHKLGDGCRRRVGDGGQPRWWRRGVGGHLCRWCRHRLHQGRQLHHRRLIGCRYRGRADEHPVPHQLCIRPHRQLDLGDEQQPGLPVVWYCWSQSPAVFPDVVVGGAKKTVVGMNVVVGGVKKTVVNQWVVVAGVKKPMV